MAFLCPKGKKKNRLSQSSYKNVIFAETPVVNRYQFKSISSIPKNPKYFTEAYTDAKKVLVETFFGPPKVGVYSPSVQRTLFLMAQAVLNRLNSI